MNRRWWHVYVVLDDGSMQLIARQPRWDLAYSIALAEARTLRFGRLDRLVVRRE